MIWVIVGAKKDKITGDIWAEFDRNLKCAWINMGITAVFMVVTIIAIIAKMVRQ
jgi:hypothetical protein